MMKLKVFVFVISCLLNAAAFSDEISTAKELLDKYAQTQDKISNCIIKSENSVKSYSSASNVIPRTFRYEEFRYDGNRFTYLHPHYSLKRPEAGSFKEIDRNDYSQHLWNGERFIGYSCSGQAVKNNSVIIRDDIRTPSDYNGAMALGFLNSDTIRIDRILKTQKEVALENRQAGVQGLSCYVIDAKTSKHGDYKLWISPERDYHIVKAVSVKKPGMLYKDDVLPFDVTMQESFEVTEFKLIDGTWIPMEVTVKHKQTDVVKGKKYIITMHCVHKRNEIILHPDHEALGSFSTDHIRNGTMVGLIGSQIDHYWQDGKVVDSEGKVVFEPSDHKSPPEGKEE